MTVSMLSQAKVREVLYHGLVKVVLVDPLAAGSVFDFLLPHFFRYYKEVFIYLGAKNGLFLLNILKKLKL